MTCIDCKDVDYPLEEEHKVWFKEVGVLLLSQRIDHMYFM